MNLLRACLALLLLVLSDPAAATAQAPDYVIVDGERIALHTNPLSKWLEQHPGAMPEPKFVSTGNWRGYVATFEVAGDRLWLRHVEVREPGPDDAEGRPTWVKTDLLRTLFPGDAPVAADWYSGALVAPRGKLVEYVHMGYGSQYERYTVLSFRAGVVTARRDLTHDEYVAYRKAQFRAWQRTDDYKARLRELADEDDEMPMSPEELEDFLYAYFAERYLSMEFE
jgi:hypothetical protein